MICRSRRLKSALAGFGIGRCAICLALCYKISIAGPDQSRFFCAPPAGSGLFAGFHTDRNVCATIIVVVEELKKKLAEEIAALENELRIELPREISKARAHGDLSENAEYHAAKERQGVVNARLGQLRARLRELSMIDLSRLPHDRVGLGSTVVVLDTRKDEEITYKLVTSEEADVAKGQISTTSPIGRALLGKRVGDEVKFQIPDGTRELEILQLTTVHDENS